MDLNSVLGKDGFETLLDGLLRVKSHRLIVALGNIRKKAKGSNVTVCQRKEATGKITGLLHTGPYPP
jgi:hypothetical protein